jgi:Na+-transporting methylmalonyl-CoA/oxaloacetate decarboxylase gamma subunit
MMGRRTGNSILGKAVLFVFLFVLITAIGGLLPTIAGKNSDRKDYKKSGHWFQKGVKRA